MEILKKIIIVLLLPLTFIGFWFGNIKSFRASVALQESDFHRVFELDTFVNYETMSPMVEGALESKDLELSVFAIKKLKEMIERRPENIKLRLLSAYINFRLSDFTTAREDALKAQKLAPRRKEPILLLEKINNALE